MKAAVTSFAHRMARNSVPYTRPAHPSPTLSPLCSSASLREPLLPPPRRGTVLLEIIVSLALFVAAATISLRITRDVLGALERSARQQAAVDVARSRLAELEAGLITLADLRSGAADLADEPAFALADPGAAAAPAWEIEVATERSPFAGLTLVELTVVEATSDDLLAMPDPSAPPPVRCTLRQLVRLRGEDAEAYEIDELLEGLEDAP